MNKVIKYLYKVKNYINISIGEVSWFTGKLPEIMSVVYLTEKFTGYSFDFVSITYLAITAIIFLTVFGWVWKRVNMYDTDKYVEAKLNPVTCELLDAARIIKKGQVKDSEVGNTLRK